MPYLSQGHAYPLHQYVAAGGQEYSLLEALVDLEEYPM